MGRQVLPPAGAQEELIELLQEGSASAFFVDQFLPLRPPNLPLCGILVEPVKDPLQIWVQVDGVKVESRGRLQQRWRNCAGRTRTNLDIFPTFLCAIALQGMQALQVFGAFEQRLAVV